MWRNGNIKIATVCHLHALVKRLQGFDQAGLKEKGKEKEHKNAGGNKDKHQLRHSVVQIVIEVNIIGFKDNPRAVARIGQPTREANRLQGSTFTARMDPHQLGAGRNGFSAGAWMTPGQVRRRIDVHLCGTVAGLNIQFPVGEVEGTVFEQNQLNGITIIVSKLRNLVPGDSHAFRLTLIENPTPASRFHIHDHWRYSRLRMISSPAVLSDFIPQIDHGSVKDVNLFKDLIEERERKLQLQPFALAVAWFDLRAQT
ncbi:hypothetical protein ES703_85040 [subsurface metagenome]